MTQTIEGLYQIQWQNTEIKFGELPSPAPNFITETEDWKESDVLRGPCPVSNKINESKQKHVFKKQKPPNIEQLKESTVCHLHFEYP